MPDTLATRRRLGPPPSQRLHGRNRDERGRYDQGRRIWRGLADDQAVAVMKRLGPEIERRSRAGANLRELEAFVLRTLADEAGDAEAERSPSAPGEVAPKRLPGGAS